ncbi:MAG: carbon-nitrogen hydrolase family protein [Bacteroidota bacterium]|nr:carbon-nitrogen hydrolase family protein [Bacteroidota bacterium]
MYDQIKVSAAQVSPCFLNKSKTVDKACEIIKQAGSEHAKLIVFPEAFISGYPDWIWLIQNSKSKDLNNLYIELVKNAVSIPDSSTKQLCDTAKQAGIYVIIGMNEINVESSNNSLYNTILFIDDKGTILGKHRKLIPTSGERLLWSQGDGSTLHVFDTSIGKLSGLICWENFMPLARHALYAMGTQILAAPTWDKSVQWVSSLQHIAREGGAFVISSCMALKKDDIPDRYDFKKLYPQDREWINTGNSCIVNPKGEIIAGPVEAKKEILYADIDLSQITASKRMFDVAGHYARPDVFKFGVNRKPNNNIDIID